MTNFWLLFNILAVFVHVAAACYFLNLGWKYSPVALIFAATTIILGMICKMGGYNIGLVVAIIGTISAVMFVFESYRKFDLLRGEAK